MSLCDTNCRWQQQHPITTVQSPGYEDADAVPVASTSSIPYHHSPASPSSPLGRDIATTPRAAGRMMTSTTTASINDSNNLVTRGGSTMQHSLSRSPPGSRPGNEREQPTPSPLSPDNCTLSTPRPPAASSSSSSSSSSIIFPTNTSTSIKSALNERRTSKSDAFFSSYGGFSTSALPPIKPPSPIVARRASESCLPPPTCALPSSDATSTSSTSTPFVLTSSRPGADNRPQRSSFSTFAGTTRTRPSSTALRNNVPSSSKTSSISSSSCSGPSSSTSSTCPPSSISLLPGIKEQHCTSTSTCTPEAQMFSYTYTPNKGLGFSELRLIPPSTLSTSHNHMNEHHHQTSDPSSSASSTSPSVYSSPSADSSALASPNTAVQSHPPLSFGPETDHPSSLSSITSSSCPPSRHTRNNLVEEEVDDTEARLQAAISSLHSTRDAASCRDGNRNRNRNRNRNSSGSVLQMNTFDELDEEQEQEREEQEEGEEDDDMYNDAPTSSVAYIAASHAATAASSSSPLSTPSSSTTSRLLCPPSASAATMPSSRRRKLRSLFEDSDDTGDDKDNNNDDDDDGEDVCVLIERVADARLHALEEAAHAFDEDDDEYTDDGGDCGEEYYEDHHRTRYNERYEDTNANAIFVPFYPLQPLEIVYTPQHRILRRRSLKRALSDSSAYLSLSSSESVELSTRHQHLRRKVNFAASVHVVDVFAAVDYPARRGPPPVEKLSMRDVLELRQIKLELASHMQTPQIEVDEEAMTIPRDVETRAVAISSRDLDDEATAVSKPCEEAETVSASVAAAGPATPTQERQDSVFPCGEEETTICTQVVTTQQEENDPPTGLDIQSAVSSYDSSAGFSSELLEPCTSSCSSLSSKSISSTTVSTCSSASLAPCTGLMDVQELIDTCTQADDEEDSKDPTIHRTRKLAYTTSITGADFPMLAYEQRGAGRKDSREDSPDSVVTLSSSSASGQSSPSMSGSLSCSPSTSDSEFGGAYSSEDLESSQSHLLCSRLACIHDIGQYSPECAKTPTQNSGFRNSPSSHTHSSSSDSSSRVSRSYSPCPANGTRSKNSEFFNVQLPTDFCPRLQSELSAHQDWGSSLG